MSWYKAVAITVLVAGFAIALDFLINRTAEATGSSQQTEAAPVGPAEVGETTERDEDGDALEQ